MSKGYLSSWEFYKGNNTDSWKPLLENPAVFYSVKLYSISLFSSPAQFSVEDGHVVILHDNILRAKRDMPLVLRGASGVDYLNHEVSWRMKYWARDGQDGWWQSKLKRALQAEEKLWPKVQSPESEWCVLERHWGWQLAGVGSKCKFSMALVSHGTRWEWQQMKQEVGIRVSSWRALCIMLSKLDFIL